MQHIISNMQALPFLLAGKCETTLVSKRTGKRFAYTITKKEYTGKSNNDRSSEWVYFVNVLRYNGEDSIYAGMLFYEDVSDTYKFVRGKKGNMNATDIPINSLVYVLNHLQHKDFNMPLEIWHHNKCGMCGRTLTTPESILTGLGPTCAKNAGVPHPKNRGKGR